MEMQNLHFYLILLVERLTKKPHAMRVREGVASCVVIKKPHDIM